MTAYDEYITTDPNETENDNAEANYQDWIDNSDIQGLQDAITLTDTTLQELCTEKFINYDDNEQVKELIEETYDLLLREYHDNNIM